MTGDGGIPAHVPEPVDGDGQCVGVHLPHTGCLGEEEHQTASRRLPPGDTPAQGRGLPGDDRGNRVTDVLGVGVHHPRHHLLVGAKVRCGDVGLGADDVDDLHGVATGHSLQLGTGETHRVHPDPALGPPEGDSHDRALPGHEHGEGAHLTEVHVGGVSDPTLGRPHGGQVLDAIAEEGLDLRVVVMSKREADDGCLLRCPEPVGDVVVEPHHLGHAVELTRGLLVHRGVEFVARGGRHSVSIRTSARQVILCHRPLSGTSCHTRFVSCGHEHLEASNQQPERHRRRHRPLRRPRFLSVRSRDRSRADRGSARRGGGGLTPTIGPWQ